MHIANNKPMYNTIKLIFTAFMQIRNLYNKYKATYQQKYLIWQPEETEKMVKFTEHLRQKQHEACAWSEVVWYDSVTVQGELFWQNQLNQLNLLEDSHKYPFD